MLSVPHTSSLQPLGELVLGKRFEGKWFCTFSKLGNQQSRDDVALLGPAAASPPAASFAQPAPAPCSPCVPIPSRTPGQRKEETRDNSHQKCLRLVQFSVCSCPGSLGPCDPSAAEMLQPPAQYLPKHAESTSPASSKTPKPSQVTCIVHLPLWHLCRSSSPQKVSEGKCTPLHGSED